MAQPSITRQPTNTTVSLGATAQFRVLATSTNPPIAYQWWFKEVTLDAVANPSAAKNLLFLTNVTLANGGPYLVVVSDASGLAATSQVATLTVDPTFTKITTGPGEPIKYDSAFMNWWDYDNDGFMDLFVGTFLSGGGTNRLYHNNHDGTFTRIANAISTNRWSGDFCVDGVVADYDNDGDEDIFVNNAFGGQNLYRNDGAGSFTRLTKEQVGPALGDTDHTMGAAWVDYDRDGFLDLFRGNGHRSPENDCLYRNNGNGTFTKMTTNDVGQIVNDQADDYRSSWADYDNDGWPDLWHITQFSRANALYHNDRGFFRKVTTGSIVGQHSGSTGEWGDYDNDGFLDLFATGYVSEGMEEPHALHRNLGGLIFTNVTTSAGIPSTHRGADASWADYDNDGFLDLYVTAQAPSLSLLLHNNGDGTFTSVDVGSPIHDSTDFPRFGIGWADYDNDGFLDLVVGCQGGAPNLFFHNNGNNNHWLKVKLTGTASNRSAIGAKVRVKASIRGKGVWQMREICGNSSVAGGSAGLLAHFGLGDATNVDLVRIEWPSALIQELQDVAANQSLKITEHQEGVTNAPSLTASCSEDGGIQLTLTGQTNLLYVFEASSNLAQWTKVAVRTNVTGAVDFKDRFATNYPQRFYRGVVP
jgi:hypothetical protein